MRSLVFVLLIVTALCGSGCGLLFKSSSSPAHYDASSRAAAAPSPAAGAAERRVPAPRRRGCDARACRVALRHGATVLPLRADEAASVRAMLTRWYWTELRHFARRHPGLSGEVAALSPSALSVSIGNGTATFFLDGYRVVRGKLKEARWLRNGRPDRGEASLLDLTGTSSVHVPIPSLGSFAGRSLELTGSRDRCVPERTSTDEAAVSAALAALSTATQD